MTELELLELIAKIDAQANETKCEVEARILSQIQFLLESYVK